MNQAPPHRPLWAGSEDWPAAEAAGGPRADQLACLVGSRLFDAAWYGANYPDVARSDIDPATHFLIQGWREGRRPNPYFDTVWYLARHARAIRADANPLLDYIEGGEAAGRAPAEFFDLPWYAAHHQAEPGLTLLAHFLARRTGGATSPLPEFDPAFYPATYADVAAAGIDPFEHYLLYGFREGRNPSAGFDTKFYLQRYLDGATTQNPLLHYRAHRHHLVLHTTPPAHEGGVFAAMRRFTRPGPAFEEVQPLPPAVPRRAKLLAYYLPQFHAIAENDAWWGEGFTEWTAIARGLPRFEGHYQPRIPRDLGHYRLGTPQDPQDTMRRQIALARGAGLHGFVQYFYWFDGRRLLDGPLDAFLADGTLDFPFCLMWANENWTRRWDGAEQDILLAQHYDPALDEALIDCLARYMRDRRYIRVEGRPLLMVYRADAIPDSAARIARWRALFAERHGERPLLVMGQAFAALDPRCFGFDAAIEFPPHKLTAGLPRRNAELTAFDPSASAHVFAYDDVVRASLDEPPPDYPLIKTAVPGWDNDARRQGQGLVLQGATPAAYQAWLGELVARARAAPPLGEAFVAINAWNEWAEGAYLEPDVHFGGAFLNATARAVTRLAPDAAAGRLLLIGHDAFPAGAQMLLLHLIERLRGGLGITVECLLLGGGALLERYRAAAPCVVMAEDGARTPDLAALLAGWAERGFTTAIVNTAVCAWIVPHLRAAGIGASLLVHEMPRLIGERRLGEGLRQAQACVDHLVFPARSVQARLEAAGLLAPDPAGRHSILAQGAYAPALRGAAARAARAGHRARLGLAAATTLVLGAGHGDLRKGFDLFLQLWRAAGRRGADAMFVWAGALDPGLAAQLAPEIAAAEATGRFRLLGFRDDLPAWFAAADAFALTSREDPYPSVVLEALCAGLPVAAFAGSGGIPDLLARHGGGAVVEMGDADAMAARLLALATDERVAATRARRGARARRQFDFDRYVAALLRLVRPGLAAITAVVPSYNYARYLDQRLGSIFAQSYPAAEIIVLDDASTDGSAAAAARIGAEWRRELRVVVNSRNSGTVFAQWRRAALLARSEFIWIAEADDAADADFLATLAPLLRGVPEIDLAFTGSRPIDADGQAMAMDYRDYYAASSASALLRDGIFPARDFARRFLAERNLILNVSAVVWRRRALLAALDRCAAALPAYRLAGDWLLYVELLAQSRGNVAYVAAPLNLHRRHDGSVTGTLDRRRHAAEIARLHRAIRARLAPDAAMRARQDSYRAGIARPPKADAAD
ncbi:MAG: glycoside hydrolase family 99-like domain-containing protein [Rhodospirillales bacterium]|nr:glycoside hydrolase family 99-like domain-containing protein [Rhodospirillales bacterium]